MKKMICFFIIIIMFKFIFPQDRTTEKIEIDWWILPIFAIDKGGNPVEDLEKRDLYLIINNQEIKEFTLYKRAFAMKEKAEKVKEKEIPFSFKKNKIIFLLFDIAFTSSRNYHLAKKIAKNIVLKAEKNTLFSLIAIDPLSGPRYLGGLLSDKQQIVQQIDRKITWDPRTKSIKTILELGGASDISSPKLEYGRLEARDIEFIRERMSYVLKQANMKYFNAFKNLSYALNSIKDHKFIYLFSEGISLFARTILTGIGGNEYLYFLNRTAGYLGKSGAVIFIINPAGSQIGFKDDVSGEDSLQQLARESGGKYMEGETDTINRQIENLTRSYFEIAFPERNSFSGKIRHITVTSKRKGVKIHTLRILEKARKYKEMKDMEKEVLVLNMLNPSPLFKSPLMRDTLRITKKSVKKNNIHYQIKLPNDFKNKHIDIFKIWLDKDSFEAMIEKDTLPSVQGNLKLNLKIKNNKIVRLVLVNEETNTVLVETNLAAEADSGSILGTTLSDFLAKTKLMTEQEKSHLDEIMTGTARYCLKLGNRVFHYICKETVNEILFDIDIKRAGRDPKLDSSSETYLTGARVPPGRQAVIRKISNKYVNDYQIISNRGGVKEQRKLIKGKIKGHGSKRELLKLDAFITSNISLTPISLMGGDGQERFLYRFIKYEKIRGIKTAVIECFPKDATNLKSVFGKLWIDLSDYSVIRMNINPISIGGYHHLLKLARYFQSRLTLNCQIDFFKKRNGIRFPTEVLISERYSGGNVLLNVVGKVAWERSRTIIKFNDYKFFEVTTAVKKDD